LRGVAGTASSVFVLVKVKPAQVLQEKKGEQQFLVCSISDFRPQSSLEMQGKPASAKI